MFNVFGRIAFFQINEHIEHFYLNLLTGFSNHNTEYCILKMLEKWKEALDKGRFVGAIFIDL